MAFILALVVRGFEAQAFVIPTGSMAPTLMGRHKEIACPQCGFVYAVNASEEVELSRRLTTVYSGLCVQLPVSGHELDDDAELQGRPHPGDDVSLRPAVPARQRPPERWDVVVFRYPEEPEVSYIKRLVGLPGETIRIYHGDIYVKAAGRATLSRWPASRCGISRRCRSPSTTTAIGRGPWPASPNGSGGERDGGWKLVDPRSSRYQVEGGPSDEWAELRYRHLVPDPEQWDAILQRPPAAARAPRHAGHRLLLVQHQHVGRLLATCSTKSSATRKAHGCSRTGSAT